MSAWRDAKQSNWLCKLTGVICRDNFCYIYLFLNFNWSTSEVIRVKLRHSCTTNCVKWRLSDMWQTGMKVGHTCVHLIFALVSRVVDIENWNAEDFLWFMYLRWKVNSIKNNNRFWLKRSWQLHSVTEMARKSRFIVVCGPRNRTVGFPPVRIRFWGDLRKLPKATHPVPHTEQLCWSFEHQHEENAVCRCVQLQSMIYELR